MTNVILFNPGIVTAEAAREKWAYIQRRGYNLAAVACSWEAVEGALKGGLAQVVVFAGEEGRPIGADDPGMATRVVRRPSLSRRAARDLIEQEAPALPEVDPAVAEAVAQYRMGYADGYVDCLTIMGERPSAGADSPTSSL